VGSASPIWRPIAWYSTDEGGVTKGILVIAVGFLFLGAGCASEKVLSKNTGSDWVDTGKVPKESI
jgi:hypothetical protein